MATDFDFFEVELARYRNNLNESLMQKRADQDAEHGGNKDELIAEIYFDVQQIETDFKKSLGIVQHVMDHSRDLFVKNAELTNAYDELKRDAEELRERDEANANVIAQAEEQAAENAKANSAMEAELSELK